MLRIKLISTGKKHAPTYRIGVGEGSAVKETFGTYNPQVESAEFKIDKKRLEYWLSQGAKLTESVDQLIRGKYEFKPYSPKKGEEAKAAGEGAAPQPFAETAPAQVPQEEPATKAPQPAEEVKEEEKSDEGTA